MCNSFEFRRRPTRRFLYYLFYFISVSMSESVTAWSHTLLLLPSFSLLFRRADRVGCRLAFGLCEWENAFAVSDSHSLSSRMFRSRFSTIEWSQFADAFSCHTFQHSQTLRGIMRPFSHWLRHTDKNHTNIFVFRHFWNIQTEHLDAGRVLETTTERKFLINSFYPECFRCSLALKW